MLSLPRRKAIPENSARIAVNVRFWIELVSDIVETLQYASEQKQALDSLLLFTWGYDRGGRKA